jgi:AcrR family transcriptional regulator
MDASRESVSRDLRRRQVLDVTRARLVAAAIDALADGGLANLTVASVIGRARVSRKTFYEIFTNRHDCFETVFEHSSARGLAVVSAACANQPGWLEATRSGLDALLNLIDEEPVLARIWFVESLGDSAVLRQRALAMSSMTDAIHRGSSLSSESRRPSRLIAEGTVGGIAHVIHARLVGAGGESFAALAGPFMYLITLPYLGQAHAKRELLRAPAGPPRRQAPAQRQRLDELLQGSKIRLTYRTIRALGAISDRPGASNLEVSIECGIKDQGQISKLLSRLAGLGLIENRGRGRALGVPNAWYITARGFDLAGAARVPGALSVSRRASSRSGATRS